MTASRLIAGRQAAVAALAGGLADALDIYDNGQLGWSDLLAWLCFGTVGVLGVAVVAGMAFGGAAVAIHGIRRMAGIAWTGVRHRDDPGAGQPTFAFWSGRSDAGGERIGSTSALAARQRAGTPGRR